MKILFPKKKDTGGGALNLNFSVIPSPMICQSIMLLINELRKRGYPIYDFDNKKKSIQGIKIIRDKIYFLAAEEACDGKEQLNREKSGGTD